MISRSTKYRPSDRQAEVAIVGGGFAGVSAAIYLARAKRNTVVIDSGRSMARWEPDVQNYLGFVEGIPGEELLRRGREQARRYGTRFVRDQILSASRLGQTFLLKGEKADYSCRRLLLATGIFHIPPSIPGVESCLGHSMFFCKDCDGYRVQGKTVGVYGWHDEAVRYALGMLFYSPCVVILTDGHKPKWGPQPARWVQEYEVPVYREKIIGVRHEGGQIRDFHLSDGTEVKMDALFTTRGDVFHTQLAEQLGARLDETGEVVVDVDARTTVPGLYAAGCVTPANCQMIVAAGQGAVAAQAINSDLLDYTLKMHALRRFRVDQIKTRRTHPTRVRRGRPAISRSSA